MRKYRLTSLPALLLAIFLVACSGRGSAPAPSTASAPASGAESSSAPEELEEASETEQEAEPEQGEPVDSGADPGAGPVEAEADVSFSGLTGGQTMEAVMEDGSTRVFQFDPEQFGEQFSCFYEGQTLRLTYTEERQGDSIIYYVTSYSPAYRGVDLLRAGYELDGIPASAVQIQLHDTFDMQFLLAAREDLTGVRFWSLAMDDSGEEFLLEREELLYELEQLDAGEQMAVSAYVPEIIPNVLLEYTLSGGEQVRYLIASDLSGFNLPVCLADADGMIAE